MHVLTLRGCGDERGFTLAPVLVAMFVVMGLAIAALAVAQGDLGPGKHDSDRKIAYAAAEAGVQKYMYHLVDDANYWAKCTAVSAPVNDPWDGTSTRRWESVPGSNARYTIELLPANGNPRCLASDPDATMIDSATGTFRVRVTGQALQLDGVTGVKRTIVVNFKRQSLLDYIYFTDRENLDPSLFTIYTGGYQTDGLAGTPSMDVTQWGLANCNRYFGDDPTLGNRAAQAFPDPGAENTGLRYNATWYRYASGYVPTCMEISFATGDSVRGPLHTNDEIRCQSTEPVIKFGREPTDRIEIVSSGETAAAPPGYRACTPYVNFGTATDKADAGTWKPKADPSVGKLELPPSNQALKRDTALAYRFVGPTSVVMSGASMTITGTREDGTVLSNATVALPADGVLYVANSPTLPCTAYNPIDPYTVQPGCGNLEVRGSYSVNVTLTAENDIIIMGNTTRAAGDQSLLGLISNNFIRVYHPVTNLVFTPYISGGRVYYVYSSCTNAQAPASVQVDAAILTLTHSFLVDNYYCGAGMGTLTVNGAIAQAYRGAVGTTSGNGFLKSYTYDDRLKHRLPPKFLDPIKAGWIVKTYNEQVPAR